MVLLEICVDSILSAINASEAGADQIELCSALSEGGLTPSAGLFLGVKRALSNTKTKIFCMIRIRRGDFNYSDEEMDAMVDDVKYFKTHNADGIVFGCLDGDNKIHVSNCRKLVTAWGVGKPITFHRAIDETKIADLEKNVDIIEKLGIARILSSGFESSAELGIENLKNMMNHASEAGVKVMPGAGINKSNAARIIAETGCKEMHASARSVKESAVASRLSMGGGSQDQQPLMICDPIKVKELIEILKISSSSMET